MSSITILCEFTLMLIIFVRIYHTHRSPLTSIPIVITQRQSSHMFRNFSFHCIFKLFYELQCVPLVRPVRSHSGRHFLGVLQLGAQLAIVPVVPLVEEELSKLLLRCSHSNCSRWTGSRNWLMNAKLSWFLAPGLNGPLSRLWLEFRCNTVVVVV